MQPREKMIELLVEYGADTSAGDDQGPHARNQMLHRHAGDSARTAHPPRSHGACLKLVTSATRLFRGERGGRICMVPVGERAVAETSRTTLLGVGILAFALALGVAGVVAMKMVSTTKGQAGVTEVASGWGGFSRRPSGLPRRPARGRHGSLRPSSSKRPSRARRWGKSIDGLLARARAEMDAGRIEAGKAILGAAIEALDKVDSTLPVMHRSALRSDAGRLLEQAGDTAGAIVQLKLAMEAIEPQVGETHRKCGGCVRRSSGWAGSDRNRSCLSV